MNAPLLHSENLSIGYPSNTPIAHSLALTLPSQALVALLGINGAGKSTLLRTLIGLQHPLEGRVFIQQREIKQLKSHELARQVSWVSTARVMVGNMLVRDLVATGRYPYTGWLGRLSTEDEHTVEEALHLTQTEGLSKKLVQELSDGERQRVMLARALAQDTPLIVLDEPTAHLDLPNSIDLIRLLNHLRRDYHKTILFSTHALQLILQTVDLIWLMYPTGEIVSGMPEELILNNQIERAFGNRTIGIDFISGQVTLTAPYKITSVKVEGPDEVSTWTRKALQRQGYPTEKGTVVVKCFQQEGKFTWRFKDHTYTRLQALLEAIQSLP
ncbi:MAG: ABC transporter ATP-binding protein [Thermonemataceae bacterium]